MSTFHFVTKFTTYYIFNLKDSSKFRLSENSGLLRTLLKLLNSMDFIDRRTYFYKHFYYSVKLIPQDRQNPKYPRLKVTF